jgi:DNA modification methylase
MPKAKILRGDCRAVMRTLAPNSVHAIVTDPPAGIAFMGKDWDSDKGGRDQWIAWMQGVAEEAMRVLKPGGHALVWALPRTSHWTATAWENAGFEVRDRVAHVFGSGFPKSADVSKHIDRMAGAEREVVGFDRSKWRDASKYEGAKYSAMTASHYDTKATITAPATAAAREWQGWGTSLKPALEDWWLLRKPMSERTVAGNVLRHGTGALNIDGCRVAHGADVDLSAVQRQQRGASGRTVSISNSLLGKEIATYKPGGRWPSHLITDGSDEVVRAFPETKSGSIALHHKRTTSKTANAYGARAAPPEQTFGDSGSAARFFQACPPDSRIAYFPKASRADRDAGLEGMPVQTVGSLQGGGPKANDPVSKRFTKEARNIHPTVKPTALMRYLCRLVTPPGGTVLDCFAGSGSTGRGAVLEGFDFIGIEQSAEFATIARKRIAAAQRELTPARTLLKKAA